jgi:hypothetical protein
MPMTSAAAEACVALAAAAPAAVVVAAGADAAALDILPVSAGFSGAIVAGLKSHLTGPTGAGWGRLQWLPTVLSGACTAVFAGPAIAEVVGWQSLRTLILMHFLIGLIGSTLCDEVLTRSRVISKRIVDRVDKNVLPPRGDV